jgi:hypothetical protein
MKATQENAAEPDLHDVAAPTNVKLVLSGVWNALLSLPFLGTGGIVVYMALFGHTKDFSPAMALVGLLPAALGWSSLSTAVRRLRAVGERRYFRAGPDGIAFRVPGGGTARTLWFGYEMIELHLTWKMIKSYYPYVMRVNGIPTQSEIRIEYHTAGGKGGVVCIPTVYFSGSRGDIAAAIRSST